MFKTYNFFSKEIIRNFYLPAILNRNSVDVKYENNFFTKNKICQIEEITWRNEEMYYAKILVGVELRSRRVSLKELTFNFF
jgi:hypothetical protein